MRTLSELQREEHRACARRRARETHGVGRAFRARGYDSTFINAVTFEIKRTIMTTVRKESRENHKQNKKRALSSSEHAGNVRRWQNGRRI